MDEEKRNTLIFFILSILVLVGYPYFFGDQYQVEQRPNIIAGGVAKITDTMKDTKAEEIERAKIQQIQQQAKIETIKIDSAKLFGEVSSKGLQFKNVSLKNYKKEIDKPEAVALFNTKDGYATTTWIADDKTVLVPDENTCWEVGENKTLSENNPVTFTWDNQNGLLFEKKISIDSDYVITIEDKVRNYSENSYVLKSTLDIYKEFEKKPEDSPIAYEGPIGFLNDKSEQIKYEDVASKRHIDHQTTGGWFGFSDKYWLVAFIPNQQAMSNVSYQGTETAYHILCNDGPSVLSGYGEIVKRNHLYLGAKEINTLDMYEEKLGIKHFDLAIDFGWMYVLTKPFLYLIAYAKDIVGNMGLGIILITLLLKILLFPLANKAYRYMNKMKEFQPKMKELQEKYKDDKMRFSQEMAAFYKKEKISPMGGCLPMLLQWPILFALYKVLYISIEMRQAPFCGWIHDLSQPDSMYILNAFGMIPVDLPGFLQIGIWPLLMGLSMLIQQKLSPTTGDPTQEKMMLIMPIMFTFMFAQMPSGLIIYWTFSNFLNILQQYALLKIDAKRKKDEKIKKEKKA